MKVKEFTHSGVTKPLEKGPGSGRIFVLLKQRRCPSVKVMGR
jgi:hypothetical protein